MTKTDKELRKQAKAAERTWKQSQLALKRKVRIFYDLQRLRLQTAGRTYERPDGVSIELHEVDVAILEHRATELHTAEKNALRDVEDHLKTIPFYVQVLADKERFKGVGPTMAGVIVSEFDIEREDTVSKMWSFAGLRPEACRRCRECHEPLTDDGMHAKTSKCPLKSAALGEGSTYASGRAQRPTRGEKLPYNAWLRTKLVGVLGPCLIKSNSPWRKFYDDYKHRKASAGWGRSDAHRHQAAIRYMVKMLLVEVHREWRTSLGLPVRAPYHEEYLGHVYGGMVSEAAAAAG
jgi:hypothetical protein